MNVKRNAPLSSFSYGTCADGLMRPISVSCWAGSRKDRRCRYTVFNSPLVILMFLVVLPLSWAICSLVVSMWYHTGPRILPAVIC